MLTKQLAHELGLKQNYRNYQLDQPVFVRNSQIWQRENTYKLSNSNLQKYVFYKFGKTLGMETKRYIYYYNGILYYYQNQKDTKFKGSCVLENLYMSYFDNGKYYVMYLSNGVKSTVMFFPNNQFYLKFGEEIAKYVIQINFKDRYQIMDEIGQGTFSKVYSAYSKKTNQKCAIKIMPKQDNTEFKTNQIVKQQKKILRYLNSPKICKMYQFFQSNDSYIFVLQFITGKDLHKILKQQNQLSLNQNLYILKQILKSLQYIHKNNIIHRDLKPHNILIDQKQKIVKLVDFGLSLIFDKYTEINKFMRCGTMGYIAPEIVNNMNYNRKPYDCKSDMFGFGIIAHMLLMNSNPIRGRNYNQTVEKNMKAEIKLDYKEIVERYGEEGYQFLYGLLNPDPKLRPTSSQALQNKFLQQKTNGQFTVYTKKISEQYKNDDINCIDDKQLVGNLATSATLFKLQEKNQTDASEFVSPKKKNTSLNSSIRSHSRLGIV